MGAEETNIYTLSDENLEIHPPGAIAELVQLAFLYRPDLEALRARRQVAEANLRFARSLRRRSLHLVLTGGYARVPSLLLQELMAAGAGFTAPLFTGGSIIDAQIEAATAQLASLSSQEEAMRQRMAFEVRSALLAYQEKSDALAEFAARVALTRTALRLATERHREGIASAWNSTMYKLPVLIFCSPPASCDPSGTDGRFDRMPSLGPKRRSMAGCQLDRLAFMARVSRYRFNG